MKINRNMSAVIANKQLLRTENKLSLSMEKLSSGYKINRSGDNPAGMAISNKMRAQIDALDKAEQNAADGTSALQIADGALSEVSSILQRMSELSIQAANGTNSKSDRESIQLEIDELKKEVDRISDNTEFNTKSLLDGSSNISPYCDFATRMDISEQVQPGKYRIDIDTEPTQATYRIPFNGDVLQDGTMTINGKSITFEKGMNVEDIAKQFRDIQEEIGAAVTFTTNSITLTSNGYGSKYAFEIGVDSQEFLDVNAPNMDLGTFITQPDGSLSTVVSGEDIQVSGLRLYNEKDGRYEDVPSTIATTSDRRVLLTDPYGLKIDFLVNEDTVAGTDYEFEVTDIGSLTLQIGANQYQTMDVRIPEVSTESLYLDEVDVVAYRGADFAIETISDAISKLNDIRSRIGAFQNRVEYAQSGLAESQENMTAAYSRIMDTDMAEEMSEYTQLNILDQASVSVLAQANDMPQQVLSLLGR